jgi:hypothetical protein
MELKEYTDEYLFFLMTRDEIGSWNAVLMLFGAILFFGIYFDNLQGFASLGFVGLGVVAIVCWCWSVFRQGKIKDEIMRRNLVYTFTKGGRGK